jgi:aryl-alcohol dehydrogenase-like predicted oxidoreductase
MYLRGGGRDRPNRQGRNEELIACAIKGHRDDYVIASKFGCLEGTAHLDTVDGMTVSLKPHELVVVPRNTTHRLRVEGRAVMLIIDAIKG